MTVWICPNDETEHESDGTGHVVCECGAGFDYATAGVAGPVVTRYDVAEELGIPVEDLEDCEACTEAELREFAERFPELARVDQEAGHHAR